MATTTRAFVNGYITGNGKNSDNRVVLLYRDGQGMLRQHSVPAEYAAFHPLDVEQRIGKPGFLGAIRRDSRVLGVEQRDGYWRVRFRTRWDRHDVMRVYKEAGVPVYEGDVDPLRRLASDTGFGIQQPRRLYLDIETDSRRSFRDATERGLARVLCWTAIGDDGAEHQACLEADDDGAEAQLLAKLWDVARGYDQLIAWNGDGFDFLVLQKRSDLLRCAPGEWRRWLWLDQMVAFERMNRNAAESGAEKQSMGLQAVSTSLGFDGKDDFDASRTWEAWEAGGEQRERMLRYNRKDVRLMLQIEEKVGYLALFQTVCDVCRVFPNSRGLLPTQQMDGFMLRLAVERGFRFPTRHYERDDEEEEHQYRGAFVLHPRERGVLHGVHVGDFAAMYPSMILTWNMSPETKRGVLGPHEGMPEDRKVCVAPTTRVVFSTKDRGILAYAVSELMRLRKHWRDEVKNHSPGTAEAIDANRRSNGYKVIANSFYGVVGSRYSRYYDEEVAESITQTGVWLIKHTMAAAESPRWGMRTTYGDTDSLFIRGASREQFAAFIQWCNDELYPKLVAQTGARGEWYAVKIEYEKMYRRIVHGVDQSGKLVAKKYVGTFEHYKGKEATEISKPDVKGYEWRRGDWNVLARTLQREVIELFAQGVLDVSRYADAVLRARDHILKDQIPLEQVQVTKSVGKELEEYVQRKKKDGTDGALQPHIALAKKMREEGKEVRQGTRIPYVVVDGEREGGLGVVHADEYDGTFDRFYMWEKLVYPATQRLCMAVHPDYDWKQYLKVRPKKERAPRTGSRAKAAAAPSIKPEQPSVPVRTARAAGAPVIVRVADPVPTTLLDLERLLLRFPGPRPVVLQTAVETIEVAATVGVHPALLAAIRQFEARADAGGNMGSTQQGGRDGSED